MHIAAGAYIIHGGMAKSMGVVKCHSSRKTKKLVSPVPKVMRHIVTIFGDDIIRLYRIHHFKDRIQIILIEHSQKLIAYSPLTLFGFINNRQGVNPIRYPDDTSVD